MNKPILFYDSDKEFYEFTNFYLKTIKVALPTVKSDGTIVENPNPLAVKDWKTSEHLFQVFKFFPHKPNIVNEILACPTPRDVFTLANGYNGTYKNDTRTDWHSIKIAVMKWVLKQKFSQDLSLKKKLVDTGDRYLVEDAGRKDKIWGNGVKGNGSNGNVDKSQGQNKLGELLMELRTELQKESGYTPPTPPSTPPYTPPPSPTPDDGKYLNNSEIHVFEAKIETELSNQGIKTSDLDPEYQGWFNYIGTKRWKAGELANYENDLKKEIERVANGKKQPNSPPKPTPPPPPKADPKYRDKWVQALEKEFQELEFGDKHDTIVRRLSEIKDKIKGTELDTEEKIERLGIEFLDKLKKIGKKKSAPNSQNPSTLSVPENEKPTELTPEEKETLLNELENLDKKTSEDLGKEEEKPVEISTIKNYFQAKNINSITLEDNGELTIEFQDKTTQITLANNEQLQQVKKYLQQKNERSINREILNISQSNHLPTKPNYLSRILAVGGLVILVIFSALIVLRQRRIRKRK